MASITIRNLDEKTKASLRIRAAHGGRSMEEEARQILRNALGKADTSREKLGSAIAARFKALGGIELPPVVRQPMRPSPFARRPRNRPPTR